MSGFCMAKPDAEYLILGRGVWIGESWERKGYYFSIRTFHNDSTAYIRHGRVLLQMIEYVMYTYQGDNPCMGDGWDEYMH